MIKLMIGNYTDFGTGSDLAQEQQPAVATNSL